MPTRMNVHLRATSLIRKEARALGADRCENSGEGKSRKSAVRPTALVARPPSHARPNAKLLTVKEAWRKEVTSNQLGVLSIEYARTPAAQTARPAAVAAVAQASRELLLPSHRCWHLVSSTDRVAAREDDWPIAGGSPGH